jgi:hypothetical protein
MFVSDVVFPGNSRYAACAPLRTTETDSTKQDASKRIEKVAAMPADDWDEADEDWTDDIDDPDDNDETARCPECGGTMFLGADKCPACGYWLSAADRRALGTDSSQPRHIRMAAAAILIVFLIGLLFAGFRLF